MAVTDLGAQAKAWALDEAAKQCFTEDYGCDVFCMAQAMQGPSGPVLVSVWVLVLTARNPLLGEGPLHHAVPVGSPVAAEENVRKEVGDGIRALRDLAASKLAGLNGASPKVPLRGPR
jgi:hypothetical protein